MQDLLEGRNSLLETLKSGENRPAGGEFALPAKRALSLGRLPEVALLGSVGLLVVALAFTSSLAGAAWAELIYWIGLLLVILPVSYRLVGEGASRQERIGLIVFIGLGLYLVKVMHSPYMLTYSDELLHFHNADSILQSGKLFGENSILPVSARYPGLEIVTTALATLSGLSIYTVGLVVIGVARLVIVLALFLFFEQVSHSGRVAGLAVLIYAANPNFLYWSAQFSYESLSLPLGALLLFALARRERIKDNHLQHGLTVLILALTAAIVVTHHVTSYVLIVFLLAISVFNSIWHRFQKREHTNTWTLALIALALTLSWLVFVANPTIRYLSQIFKLAFTSVIQLLAGEAVGRLLFTSPTGVEAPLWERLVGIGSVLLTLLGILLGLLALWRRKRFDPLVVVLAGAALLYFGILGLRFTGAGWEIANRASEFLFIGIAFVVGFGFVVLRLNRPRNHFIPFVFMGYAAILFTGGVIAGWIPSLRLAQPLQVYVNGATLQPEGLEAAHWMLERLGPDNEIAAPPSDALMMLAYGKQYSLTGRIYSILELLTEPHDLEWQTDVLQKMQIHYMLIDRRRISWDGMRGLYFDRGGDISQDGDQFFPVEVTTQFDRQKNVPRIFDSGDLVIYDVGDLSGVKQTK
jgi:hypothetical protein